MEMSTPRDDTMNTILRLLTPVELTTSATTILGSLLPDAQLTILRSEIHRGEVRIGLEANDKSLVIKIVQNRSVGDRAFVCTAKISDAETFTPEEIHAHSAQAEVTSDGSAQHNAVRAALLNLTQLPAFRTRLGYGH